MNITDKKLQIDRLVTPVASSRTFSTPCSGLQQSTGRSSLSMASFRVLPLMPVAKDLASSCSLCIRHLWVVETLVHIKGMGIGMGIGEPPDYVSFNAEQG